jgi:hypothetical protein
MATATISMDDALFTLVEQAAGENLSEWIAKACRSRLLAEAARAQAEWERAHPAEAAKERAAEAARNLEAEAEQEVWHQAEEAARRRGGDHAEPTAEERACIVPLLRPLLAGQQPYRYIDETDLRWALGERWYRGWISAGQ